MPKESLIRWGRRALARCCVAALVLSGVVASAASGAPPADDPLGPPPKPLAPCAWWYGIGESPTSADIRFAARHYDLVVLNATEIGAMRRLRALNPEVKVLVYKDLSSTRNYPGVVYGEHDAFYLPTGVGYFAAQREHPEWFAVDRDGRRIEWKPYPQHWQMAVWNPEYQKAWTRSVVDEVVREGWDGVLADNDFSTLRHYSDAVLEGTGNAEGTDRLLREGLDAFLSTAGDALRQAGKMLIPNISESHLTAGRWSAHSRYDGGMEENFGLRDDGGAEGLLTFRGNEWKELRAQAALGESWLLLVTHVKGKREERVGYATAALLAGPHTCWSAARTPGYRNPDWSSYQGTGLGEAVETANRLPSGVWTRQYTNGWVAVNPTGQAAQVAPPPGMVTPEGDAVPAALDLPAADAVVLVVPKQPPTTTTPTTTTGHTTGPTTTGRAVP